MKIISRAESGRKFVAAIEPWPVEPIIDLPDVPVLPETLLRIVLEVQEPCVDLRAMSQLVLSDLGATIQILRLAGREYGDAEVRPNRIEDCIADLGLDACIEALSAETAAHDSHYRAIQETWTHSRQIAEYSLQVAEDMPEVNPEEAYLVGLLHSIGLLSTILGWDGSRAVAKDSSREGYNIARKWSLPHFVVESFADMHLGRSSTPWPEVVRKAHRLSSRSSILCPFEPSLGPLLWRAV